MRARYLPSRHPRACSLSLAVGLACLSLAAAPAWAQTAGGEAAAADQDELQLNRIVVTGTSKASTKMRSSVSVSSVEGDSEAITSISKAMSERSTTVEQTVDAAAVARVLAAVPTVGDRRSKAVWSQALRRCFPSAERSEAKTSGTTARATGRVTRRERG